MKSLYKLFILLAIFMMSMSFLIACTKDNSDLKSYTITFESNGGGAIDSIFLYENEVFEMPTNPVKSGFIFDGWYEDNETFENKFVLWPLPTSDVTAYAKWSVASTVTFESNGGTDVDPITVRYNSTTMLPFMPTKEGYSFYGWFLDDETFLNEFTYTTTVSGDMTVYAKWGMIRYTVSFESNGGSSVSPVMVDYNTSISMPMAPTRAGYSFGGWYEDNTTFYNAFTESSIITEDIGVYALWVLIKIVDINLLSYSYDELNEEYKLVDCDISAEGFLEIPSTYDDGTNGQHSVTTISENAFYNCNKIELILIPNSVTVIEERAFYNCSLVNRITLPNSISSIQKEAFAYCIGLTNIVIPSSVTTIQSNAFRGCTSLENITIPSSVSYIGEYAFTETIWLDEFTDEYCLVGDGVLIDYNGDITATTMTIPNTVKSIAYDFVEADNIDNMTSLVLSSNLEIISASTFRGFSSITSLIIPNSVTTIEKHAFSYCSSLTSLAIPVNVTYIGDYAFSHCDELVSVTNLVGVIHIGAYAFLDCGKLESINIPNSVTYIGNYAFSECDNIDSVTIGNKVEFIGKYAFDDTEWYENQTVEEFIIVGDGVLLIYNGTEVNVILDPSIKSISTAFSGNSNILSVTLTESILSLSDSAFENCISLESINFPSGLTSIGESVFANCEGLASVIIPDTITAIYDKAFKQCDGLIDIYIPDSVTYIGADAFQNNSSLRIFMEASQALDNWDSNWNSNSNPVIWNSTGESITIGDLGYGLTLDNEAIIIDYLGTSTDLVIPETINYSATDYSVVSIASLVFFNNSTLISVSIPDSITSISENAFNRCSNLVSITIPVSVTVIERYVFKDCNKLVIYSEATSNPTNWNTYWNISNCAVVWNSLGDNIVVDDIAYGLTIDNKAIVTGYTGTESELIIPETVTYNTIDYSVTMIARYAFEDCVAINRITLPNSLVLIEQSAFNNCIGLTSIIIPASVTIIEQNAFSGCTFLVINSEVTSQPIGWNENWNISDCQVIWAIE